jgi:hypothetical protein
VRDSIEAAHLEKGVQRPPVAQITPNEARAVGNSGLVPAQQIVEDSDLMARFHEQGSGRRADVACATRDKDMHTSDTSSDRASEARPAPV